MAAQLNCIEEEVVFLKAVNEMVNSMMSLELLTLHGTDPDSSITFKTSIHQRLFNVILVDFLSRTDKKAPIKQSSYLGALRSIIQQPNFNRDDSVASLREATSAFVDWLNQEIRADVWMPSIETSTSVIVPRLKFLKMCGDISKHNILRSVGVAEDLQELLKASGTIVNLDTAMIALDDFYERFHKDILNYHSSTIAEFLNNIRWGIFEYLQPEFRRSIVCESGDPPKYRYNYPTGLDGEFARQRYWDLMNEVRNQPYLRRFHVAKCLKLRY